eukprot:4673302-Amphidinium_carterae.3
MPYRECSKTRSIVSSWELIAQAVDEYQGCLAMEWPDTCELWTLPVVKRRLQRRSHVDTSQLWLSRVGSVRKVWMVAHGQGHGRSLPIVGHGYIPFHTHPLAHIQNIRVDATWAKIRYPAYFAVVVHQAVCSWVHSSLMGCTAYSRGKIPSTFILPEGKPGKAFTSVDSVRI